MAPNIDLVRATKDQEFVILLLVTMLGDKVTFDQHDIDHARVRYLNGSRPVIMRTEQPERLIVEVR